PTEVTLNALAERLLADADLKRPETRFLSQPGGQQLVEGWAACAASRVHLPGDQRAHRRIVAVAGTRKPCRRAVQSGNDMYVLPKRRERIQAGRELKIGPGFFGDPVLFRDAIAIEPEDEARLDGARFLRRRRGIGCAARIEHGVERGKPDP